MTWSSEEIAKLKALAAAGHCSAYAAREIGRTQEATQKKAVRLGLTLGHYLPPPDGSPAALATYGADGTRDALERHIARLGVNRAAAHYGVAKATFRRMRCDMGYVVERAPAKPRIGKREAQAIAASEARAAIQRITDQQRARHARQLAEAY